MKKILFLLLAFVTVTMQSQTANGSETQFEAVQLTNPQTVTSVSFLPTIGTTGVIGQIDQVNLPFVHKTGDNFNYNYNFNDVLTQNASTLNIEKRILQPESNRLPQASTDIFGWGDSLTAGAGSTGGLSYPVDLATLTGFGITNKGVGGETSTQIKDRLVADTGNYGRSVIIWAGRNNYVDATTVKADIATMVSTIGHSRYLVVSILNGEYGGEYKGLMYYNMIVQLNADLKAIYGSRYVELREYLVSLHDNSAQDLIDFGHDIVPTSLRSDPIHLNNLGYQKTAEFFNQRLGVLFGLNGYLQSKDLNYYSIGNQSTVDQIAAFRINGTGIGQRFLTRNGTAADFSKGHYVFQNGASNRHSFTLTGSESTGNLGSNLAFVTYDDTGTILGNPFTLFRSTGNVLLKSGATTPTDAGFRLDIQGTLRIGGTTTLTTTPSTGTDYTQVLSRNPSTFNMESFSLGTASILNQGSVDQVASFRINSNGIAPTFITRNGTASDFSKTHYRFQNGASNRIALGLTGVESTGNLGSNLAVVTSDDAGALLMNPFTIFRGTGNVVFKGTSATPVDAGFRIDVFGNSRFTGDETIVNSPTASAGSYEFLTRNTTSGLREKIASSNVATSASVALKADLASPALTGTPTAPTATAGTNTTQLATTAFATGAISTLNSFALHNSGNESFSGTKSGNSGTGRQVELLGSISGVLTASTASPATVPAIFGLSSSAQTAIKASGGGSFTGFLFEGAGTAATTVFSVDNGGVTTGKSFVATGGAIRLKNYTVATLPTGVQGDTAFVTDALTPTYLGVLVGGGSVITPVFYNGSTWVAY